MRINEILSEKLNRTGSSELVIFDIDDTLLHTTAKINVVKDGEVIRSLTNQEFNNYKLQPGEEFDFGEFRNAAKFEEESVPIGPMLDQLRSDLASGKNVVMLTARSDFDNQKAVWRTFKRHGIDINKDVHLYRAGNQPGSGSPAVKKAIHVIQWLKTGKYNRVTMYDDSEKNLTVFKSLEEKFPNVEFAAHHVNDEGGTKQLEGWSDKYKRSINCNNPKGFSQRAHCQGRKKNEEIEPKDVHKLADKKKVDWDNNPKFLALSKKITSVSHLDQMNQAQLEKMLAYLKSLDENFADGKNPQDKGDSKRHGVPTKASISTLRKVAKQGGRKGQLAHWMANMKAGRAKAKKN